MSKIQLLRNQIRAQRSQLTAEDQQRAAMAVCNYFINSSYYQPNLKTAIYFANENELNPHPIVEKLWQANHSIYLPILHENNHGYMDFGLYHKNDLLQKNRFGIPEPIKTDDHLDDHLIDPKQLDIVLMPLVAFDTQGNRVGMGAGFL